MHETVISLIILIIFSVPTDLQKPHVSNEEEASAIQKLCNQGRSSSHDQEEAEPQWTEDKQMETDPPLFEEQGDPGPQWIKEEEEDLEPPMTEEENEKPTSSKAKEEQTEPDSLLIKEREEPEPPCIKKEEEEPESPLLEEREETESPWPKHEQLVPEHLSTRQDQNLHSSQEGEQLVQKRSIALMETSTLQE
ncbi:hypothetical protein ATANTOWER_025105, partial [Ataeniobius toweri]|nr:hypothetical protein [Ataeniobius toweri]